MKDTEKEAQQKNTIVRMLKWPGRTGRRAYNWTLKWGKTKYATLALFLLAFAESSFFPIPPDVLMLALTVSRPKQWLKMALITLSGSVLGAILGYFIGFTLFEAIGQPMVDFYHLHEEIAHVGKIFEENAFYAILISSITPIPYKVFTISTGLFKISLPILIISSIIGRGARFLLVAYLTGRYGVKIQKLIEKYFDVLGLLLVVAIILVIVIARLL
ncbi:MAG: YqaA family protein [Candidatus Dojkabacteria bacterium]